MAKIKALISFAVTAKLIWVFVFAYAKSLFSHDAAHMYSVLMSYVVAKNVQCGGVDGSVPALASF